MNRTGRAAYCWRTTDAPGIGVAVLARRGSHEGVVGTGHDGWPAEAKAVADVREHMPASGVALHSEQDIPPRWREIYHLANKLTSTRVGQARGQALRASLRRPEAREDEGERGRIRYMNPSSFPGGIDRLHGMFRRATDVARAAWGWTPGDVDIFPMKASRRAAGEAYVGGIGDIGPKKIRLNLGILRDYSDDSIVDVILHELCHHRREEIRPIPKIRHDRIFCELLSAASPGATRSEPRCDRFIPTRPNPRTDAQRPSARPRPMPFPTYDLAVGDSLWWAAHDPRIWGEPVQWFTDNPSTARAYMEGRYGEEGDWATMYFDVRRAARLVHMRDWGDLDRLARFLRVDHDGDPHDIAPALCAAGYDGWWIDEGEFDGADVMLCNPREHVAELHLVDQGDGWTGEDPRLNPARGERRQRPLVAASGEEDPEARVFARGFCGEFAAALHELFGYDLAAFYARSVHGDVLLHAFALHPQFPGVVIDAFGEARLADVRRAVVAPRGARVVRRAVTIADLDAEGMVGLYPEVVEQARDFIRARPERFGTSGRNLPAGRRAGRRDGTTPRRLRMRPAPRPNPGRPLRAQLAELRPQMAAAAQVVYDDWGQNDDGFDEEFGEGGICDRVAEALWRVIDNGIPDVEIRDGGWDGDDHAYLIAQRGQKAFVVDIPPRVYETGGGYSWRKRKGVRFDAADVVIEETDAVDE